jgi:hypothetical protein
MKPNDIVGIVGVVGKNEHGMSQVNAPVQDAAHAIYAVADDAFQKSLKDFFDIVCQASEKDIDLGKIIAANGKLQFSEYVSTIFSSEFEDVVKHARLRQAVGEVLISLGDLK